MRALRSWWVAAGAVGAAFAMTPGRSMAQGFPDAPRVLAFRPILPGVDHDVPADAEVAACKVEPALGRDGKSVVGFALRDGQGKLLRRFVDTDPTKLTKRDGDPKPTTHIDRWSYYRDGFEVYRESDTDEDGVADEARWLNAGGTRIAKVKPFAITNPQGKREVVYRIVSWDRISAEEATKVLVQALIAGDSGLLDTIMATPDDAKSLGLPAEVSEKLAADAASRRQALLDLRKQLKGWDAETAWSRFDGMLPRVIPSDAAPALDRDLTLYENAIVFVTPSKPENAANAAYLHVPELIQVGETWKLLDLPKAVDPAGQAEIGLADASLRSMLYRGSEAPGAATAGADEMDPEIGKALADLDAKMPPYDDTKALAQWHLDRITVLQKAVAGASTEAAKQNFYKMIVHDLAEAYRTGLYPAGAKVLDDMIAMGGKVGSFASYRKILAEFDIEADQPGVDYAKVQADLVQKLDAFLAANPQADEAADVLFQIATVHEFNNDGDKARQYWTRLAQQFPDSAPGRKAPGAVKRLDLEGKPLALAGPTTDGRQASTADTKGKSTLVLYWMSITEPDRREVEELVKLQEKYRDKGFAILSINLDADRATLDEYLKANSLPWPVIFEDGGLDSRLANELGIISTPTMILLDPQGNVVSAKIRKASEVEKYLEKPLAARPVGLNLDVK